MDAIRRPAATYPTDAQLAARADDEALMEGLLWGIRSREFEIDYQPRFDLRRRAINAVEALVRWRHPRHGLLAPALFVPLATEAGHIRTLTDWVLTQAITDQATLARAGFDLEVSVNIAGALLLDRTFADQIDRVIEAAPSRVCFDITEAGVLENPPLALETISRFKSAGVGISIDDYGAGLSSLRYLKQIAADELKIHETLIADMALSQRDAMVVRSTIDLAHGLGMKVTAEGVESAATFQLLAAMGCDNVQGHLIAKPEPLNELLSVLRQDGDKVSYG